MFLNPSKIDEMERIKREKQEIKRQELLDLSNVEAIERMRFDKKERTIHKEIPPAKDRMNDYKRKCFGRLFTGLQEARNQ